MTLIPVEPFHIVGAYLIVGFLASSIAFDGQRRKEAEWTYRLWWPFQAVVFGVGVVGWPVFMVGGLLKWIVGGILWMMDKK